MNRRRQALQLCLDSAVVIVIQIVDQFLFEVLYRLKFLQIQQLAFEQPKENPPRKQFAGRSERPQSAPHIRNLGAAKRRGRENSIEDTRPLRRGLHAAHLHPHHAPDAGKRGRKAGKLHGTDHVKAQKAPEGIRRISSPALSEYFRVWVTVWVKPKYPRRNCAAESKEE